MGMSISQLSWGPELQSDHQQFDDILASGPRREFPEDSGTLTCNGIFVRFSLQASRWLGPNAWRLVRTLAPVLENHARGPADPRNRRNHHHNRRDQRLKYNTHRPPHPPPPPSPNASRLALKKNVLMRSLLSGVPFPLLEAQSSSVGDMWLPFVADARSRDRRGNFPWFLYAVRFIGSQSDRGEERSYSQRWGDQRCCPLLF